MLCSATSLHKSGLKNTLPRVVAGLLLALSALAAASDDAAPDYAQMSAWAAYPGHVSHADDTPAGVSEKLKLGVDVFFVHPTTYLMPRMTNAAFDAGGGVRSRIDAIVMKLQASAFNGCCDIYAPRYRQASIRAITHHSKEAYAVTDLAYSDVARAFDAFLVASKNRPFIIASHSQGSIHALRLLQQRIAGTPLQQRMVAAYVVGAALPLEIAQSGLPICDAPTATGCVLTWNSVDSGSEDARRLNDSVIWLRGSYQPIAGRPIVCVNPLDWRMGSQAPAENNLGAIHRDGPDDMLSPPIPRLTAASCKNGLLGVDIAKDQRKHFRDVLTLAGSYHDFDYSLFYMNIRANAIERSRAWLAARKH